MTALDGRMYVEGQRTACPPDLQDAADVLERSDGVAWIGLMDPGPDELKTAAARSRSLPENGLTVHSTLVTREQNEAMQRMLSASLAQGEESRRLAEETIEQGE